MAGRGGLSREAEVFVRASEGGWGGVEVESFHHAAAVDIAWETFFDRPDTFVARDKATT